MLPIPVTILWAYLKFMWIKRADCLFILVLKFMTSTTSSLKSLSKPMTTCLDVWQGFLDLKAIRVTQVNQVRLLPTPYFLNSWLLPPPVWNHFQTNYNLFQCLAGFPGPKGAKGESGLSGEIIIHILSPRWIDDALSCLVELCQASLFGGVKSDSCPGICTKQWLKMHR